jgi:hypothetical protein
MSSSPYFFVYFNGPATVADAARRLSMSGMDVVENDDGFTVRWAHRAGPVLDVGLNSESWVIAEARELAGAKDLPALAGLNRRFEVPFADFDDLEEVLSEYNTLFEVQATLQDLTGGYIWMSWNGNVITPEA